MLHHNYLKTKENMSKNFKMCEFKQQNAHTKGWIEERGAKLGAMVEIIPLDGLWEVTAVSSFALSGLELSEKQRSDRRSCQSIK
jgi:hypothetical protein